MNRGPALALAGIAVGLGLAAVVSTCTGPDTSRSVDPRTSLDEQCGDEPENASRVVVGNDGFTLGAAMTAPLDADSNGPVVVLRHGASHTLCDWLDWASTTSEETGATVLLMDRRGQGSSPGRSDLSRDPSDVAALIEATDHTRDLREFVLVGSSMGNSAALSALEALPKAPCAYVGVSPVPAFGPLDGVSTLLAAPGDRVPGAVHLTWAVDDGDVADDVVRLGDAARARGVRLSEHPVDGDAHARAVLDEHESARDFVEDALLSCG